MVKEKRCPKCQRVYFDETLNYCLADGSFLFFPEELAEPTADDIQLISQRPIEAPTEAFEAPTEMRRLATDTEDVVEIHDPQTQSTLYTASPTSTRSGWNFRLIGVCLAGFLFLIGAIYFLQAMLSGENKLAPTVLTPPIEKSTPVNTPTTNAARARLSNDGALTGTTWYGVSPKGAEYKFSFLSGGELVYFSAKNPSNNPDSKLSWKMDGDKITFLLNTNPYWETWKGVRDGDNRINFSCRNTAGETWNTTATSAK